MDLDYPANFEAIVYALAQLSPYAARKTDGDLVCFFCHADDAEPHFDGCIWKAAKSLHER